MCGRVGGHLFLLFCDWTICRHNSITSTGTGPSKKAISKRLVLVRCLHIPVSCRIPNPRCLFNTDARASFFWMTRVGFCLAAVCTLGLGLDLARLDFISDPTLAIGQQNTAAQATIRVDGMCLSVCWPAYKRGSARQSVGEEGTV